MLLNKKCSAPFSRLDSTFKVSIFENFSLRDVHVKFAINWEVRFSLKTKNGHFFIFAKQSPICIDTFSQEWVKSYGCKKICPNGTFWLKMRWFLDITDQKTTRAQLFYFFLGHPLGHLKTTKDCFPPIIIRVSRAKNVILGVLHPIELVKWGSRVLNRTWPKIFCGINLCP